MTVRVYRESADQNGERHTPQQGRQPGSRRDPEVCPGPPFRVVDLAAPFDGDGAQDHTEQDRQQRQIQRGEHGRVPAGKRGEYGRAGGDQPDFVAVPDRSDGVECRAPVGLRIAHTDMSERRHQHAHAEVEPF